MAETVEATAEVSKRHTQAEIIRMRRRIYKYLVDTDPEYVKNELRRRREGMVSTLILHFQFSPEEAREAAYNAMWWCEDAPVEGSHA